MNKIHAAVIATALILLSAFVLTNTDNSQTNLQKDPPKVVPHVDV